MDCSQIDAEPEKFSVAMGTQNDGRIANMVKYCSQRVFHSFGLSPVNCGNWTEGCAWPRPLSSWLACANGERAGGEGAGASY